MHFCPPPLPACTQGGGRRAFESLPSSRSIHDLGFGEEPPSPLAPAASSPTKNSVEARLDVVEGDDGELESGEPDRRRLMAPPTDTAASAATAKANVTAAAALLPLDLVADPTASACAPCGDASACTAEALRSSSAARGGNDGVLG